MNKSDWIRRATPIAATLAFSLAAAEQAAASEGGASIYLLGAGGPGAGVSPPVKGVFFSGEAYYYKGSASAAKQFVVGGNVVAGLDAKLPAVFPTVLWVPSTNVGGAVLGLAAVVPLADPDVRVSAVVTGPRGGTAAIARSDSAFVVGDPILMATLGWKQDKWHVQSALTVNVPIGHYREGELANVAFHRWAADTSVAVSWVDEESGWDLTGKTGVTINGENPYTNYTTGTELHVEAAVEKTLSPSWSAGLQAYYLHQLSGDSGPGAALGAFKGRVTGVGATAAYHFKLADKPATLRFQAFTEFNVKNRLEGDAFTLSLSVPLSIQMPVAR